MCSLSSTLRYCCVGPAPFDDIGDIPYHEGRAEHKVEANSNRRSPEVPRLPVWSSRTLAPPSHPSTHKHRHPSGLQGSGRPGNISAASRGAEDAATGRPAGASRPSVPGPQRTPRHVDHKHRQATCFTSTNVSANNSCDKHSLQISPSGCGPGDAVKRDHRHDPPPRQSCRCDERGVHVLQSSVVTPECDTSFSEVQDITPPSDNDTNISTVHDISQLPAGRDTALPADHDTKLPADLDEADHAVCGSIPHQPMMSSRRRRQHCENSHCRPRHTSLHGVLSKVTTCIQPEKCREGSPEFHSLHSLPSCPPVQPPRVAWQDRADSSM